MICECGTKIHNRWCQIRDRYFKPKQCSSCESGSVKRKPKSKKKNGKNLLTEKKEKIMIRNYRIVDLYTNHGLTPEEISARVGIKPENVKIILRAAGVYKKIEQAYKVIPIFDDAARELNDVMKNAGWL